MPQCPYPETFNDRASGKIESNSLYLAWHEGFEAHKVEIITRVKLLEIYVRELATEIRSIKELKRELEKQRTKL